MAEAAVEKKSGAAQVDPCAGENFHPGKAWMAVIAAVVFLCLGSSALNLMTPILSLVLEEFAQDANFGATLNSIVSLTSLIVCIPIGFLMNKIGFRKTGYIGYFILLISGVLGATIANTEATMLFVRILQGAGYVFPPIICIYLVTQWFPKNKQSLPITIVASATSLAKVVTLQMSKIGIAWMGWRGQFAVYAILCVIGIVLFVFFMRPGPGFAVAEAERLAKEKREKAPILVVLKNPYIWLIIIAQFAFGAAQRGLSSFQNMILVDNCGVSNNFASDLGTILGLMPILGGIVVGWLLGSKLKAKNQITAALLAVYFIAYVTPYFLNTVPQAVVFCVVAGFAAAVPQFCQACLPRFSASPAILVMALTIFNFVGKYIAGLVAPYIVSITQTLTGSWFWCWVPMAVVAVVGILCVVILTGKLTKMDRDEGMKA